jgi:hypothetical protein
MTFQMLRWTWGLNRQLYTQCNLTTRYKEFPYETKSSLRHAIIMSYCKGSTNVLLSGGKINYECITVKEHLGLVATLGKDT